MKTCSSIEALESRIAPATLLSASAFSYTDIDGDTVKVTFSKDILTEANIDTLVSISGGFSGTGFQDLMSLNLFELGLTANGLNIKVIATPSKLSGGDGQISGLAINASEVDLDTGTGDGIDLGSVSIDGDLDYIDAGDDDGVTRALKSLTAKSAGLNASGTISEIFGPAGAIKFSGNFAGYIRVETDTSDVPDIKSLTIGGSILGNLGEDAGRIETFGAIGPITVRGDIVGGDFDFSGSILSANPIKKVTVRGSLIGGDGADTGLISGFTLGPVSLGGSLIGGNGSRSGVIEAFNGDVQSVTITGSVYGGPGDNSGLIQAGLSFEGDGSLKKVLIRGSVIGVVPDSGVMAFAATIRADNSIGKVTILGSLVNANIVAGVDPGADQEYGTEDDGPTIGFPDAARSIGSIVIKGGASASVEGFAITALSIGSINAGGPTLKPSTPFVDFDNGFLLGGGAGIFVIQI